MKMGLIILEIYNELKKKTKDLMDVQEGWKERQPGRDTVRSTINIKSRKEDGNFKGNFWRVNKREEDGRKLKQIFQIPVQSIPKEHEAESIGTINALAVKKQTLLNPAVRRILEINQIIRHSDHKHFADLTLF